MDEAVAIPILPSRNLDETRAFYERLGFRVTGWWPHEFGGYAIFARGGLTIHFFSFSELSPAENYAQCYWRVNDVDKLHAEYTTTGLSGRGMPRIAPVEDKPWGMREFALTDPNGNLIRVGRERSPAPH